MGETEAIRAEQAVIGLALTDRKALKQVTAELTPGDYARPIHADIHLALCKLEHQLPEGSEPSIDIFLMLVEGASDIESEDAGSIEAYLYSCVNRECTILELPKLVEQIKTEAKNRKYEEALLLCLENKKKEGVEAAVQELQQRLDEIDSHYNEPSIIWAEDIEEAATDWVISGLLPKPGIALLAGLPGAGKTTLCAEWAYHVATGKSIYGSTCKQGRVLWLGFDDDFSRIASEKLPLYGDIPRQAIMGIPRDRLKPLTRKTLTFYRQICIDHGVILIVADTIFHFAPPPGGKFNDAGAVIQAMQVIRQLVDDCNVCVLGTWHLNKNELSTGVVRIGNSLQLPGQVDTALVMIQNTVDPDLCALEFAKDRCGEMQGKRITLRKSQGRWLLTDESPTPETTKEKVYRFVLHKGRATRQEILAHIGDSVSPRTVDRALAQLTGRIKARGGEPIQPLLRAEQYGKEVLYIPIKPGEPSTSKPDNTAASIGTIGVLCERCNARAPAQRYENDREGWYWYECPSCGNCGTVNAAEALLRAQAESEAAKDDYDPFAEDDDPFAEDVASSAR